MDLLGAGLPVSGPMTDYYVRSDGAVTNNGTSPADALPNLTYGLGQQAVSAPSTFAAERPNGVVAGDRLIVADSATYTAPDAAGGYFTTAQAGTGESDSTRIIIMASAGCTPSLTRETINTAVPNNAAFIFETNYVTLRGFTFPALINTQISASVTGAKILYCTFNKGEKTMATNNTNYNAIFTPGSGSRSTHINAEIAYCVFNDIRLYATADSNYHHNGAAIVLFDCEGFNIHHNSFYRCSNGVYEKRGGKNNVIAHNYFQGFNGYCAAPSAAIMVSSNTHDTTGVRIHHNVAVDMGLADMVQLSCGGAPTETLSDWQIYNNTGYLVRSMLVADNSLMTSLLHYNNLLWTNVSSVTTNSGGQGWPAAMPADQVNDYNLYWGPSNGAGCSWRVASAQKTEAQWKALTSPTVDQSPADITQNPLFVGSDGAGTLSTTAAAAHLALQAGSPAKNAGRVGGVSTGAVTDIGALTAGATFGAGGQHVRMRP